MGHGWRRVMENVRQKVGADRTFKATSNARNEAMFKEATEFCSHLRLLERDLRSMHKEIDGKFTNLRIILSSPLPRAYEEGLNGAVPCSEEAKLIGQGVGLEILQQASNNLWSRLDDEVIKPLRSWLVAYRTVCDRMAKLEALRLELDSRRRTVDSLTDKLERLEKTQPSPQQKEKHEQEMEKVAQLLQHKRDKLSRTQHAYRELEQTVFNSLNTLIKDTGVLRDYTGLSLQIIQDCFQKSHAAFSTATPLLDYNSTSDNLFNQHQSPYQQLPVMEKAQSERVHMLRQLTEQRPMVGRAASAKDADRGAAVYAVADDGGDAYGIDQQMQPQVGMQPYADLAPNVGPMAGAGVNPYQGAYQQNPHAARYMPNPSPTAWQAQAMQY
ncbi:hypothetical protein Agub_g7764 [Astrephomene gubernaculifera]|uniref:BAR domain-containing protein n=1 Tax=Astrephomene gubernaculifera TaxID=47775 RepID=A0AAD3HMN7_9CHLO|nr:hypothetical protein Agub_g7764 [Astrephomene gubernaculifera]